MSRCSLCPAKYQCVPPSGPGNKGGMLFIGEAPGFDENKRGLPFVGKTGREVNEHYLPLTGLSRDSEDFTNAIKCMPDVPKGKLDIRKTRDLALLDSCSSHFLYKEIKDRQPSLIIPMGTFACYAIDPSIDLEIHHGMPRHTEHGLVFPMYHPAGGIHEPKKMLLIRNDWIRLRRYIRGHLHNTSDRFVRPDYREATERDVKCLDPTLPMGADTESSRSQGPYFLTYSQEPGHGYLIRATNTRLLNIFQERILRWESTIYFHNWPYDWSIVEDMGLQFPINRVTDTMVMAWHLGNLPQGLKTLAYRLLGMEMQDFEDLVKPYSLGRIFDYYDRARKMEWPKPEEELVLDDKTGKYKLYKPQGLGTKLKRLFTDLSKNESKDLLSVWDTWEAHQQELEEKVGPYTGLDIADVPFEKSLYYACRDSDAVIRLVPILMKMREQAEQGKLQEYWDVQ